jgi:predicted nuclease of predicted toxin-antitoxin system
LLAAEYPQSIHVRDVGLSTADDQEVWEYAAARGFAIVSKDTDFQSRALLYGHPPKVVWIQRGSLTTTDVATLLRAHHEDVMAFEADADSAVLVLT